MTIQLHDGGSIGRTLMTDGDVQLYATKLDGNGFVWNVSQGYTRILQSRIFSKAVDAYHGLARKEMSL